jgi:phospho-N-acetylmuramoyl-pentapeptide-transferase
MGDTGSLTIGGLLRYCIAVRKELLIPLLCGVFLIENLSVVIQVSYFKYTKKLCLKVKVFLIAVTIASSLSKEGYHEKIVTRFWIVAILLATSLLPKN